MGADAGRTRGPRGRAARPERAICILVTVGALAPFLRKPLHIDDPLFVWTARQIHAAPLDFYGFTVNWTGVPHPMTEFMRNPPLAAYWHALVAWLGGWSELSLHLGALPWALAATLATYALAQRLCARPLLATLISIAAPVFLVSATSLGSDVPMLALWLWAVVLWVRGLDEHRQRLLAASMLLCCAAALTKYFAVGLIPLLAAYTLARERRASPRLVWLAMPLLAIAAYELATQIGYGHGLLGDAIGFSYEASGTDPASPWAGFERGLIGLLFVGGAVVTPGLFAPFVWSGRAISLGMGGAGLLALLVGNQGALGALSLRVDSGGAWAALLHIACFAGVGLHVVALGLRDAAHHRDSDALLLLLALLGTLAFGICFNWTVNARAMIALAPLAAILTVRALERPGAGLAPARPWLLGAALLLGGSIGLAVTWADFRLALSFRSAAEEMVAAEDGAPDRVRFLGHWGFQYYMEQRGARAVDFSDDHLDPGDLLLVPENSPGSNRVPWKASTVVRTRELPASPGISIQSWETRAAFHAAVRGPLPFFIGGSPLERFVLVRMERPMKTWGGVLVPAR
jgi:hypothetical protein